jgi:DNA-directed RNA polymerase specialized sigma24 family protein
MAAMSDTFTVTATRWDKGWELHIDGVGVTQARKLSEADLMVRDLIARREGIDAENIEVHWTFDLGEELDSEIKAARAAVSDVERAQQEAAAKSRSVVAGLKAAGLAGNEVARVLGLSPQRISQLIGPTKRTSLLRSKSAGKR